MAIQKMAIQKALETLCNVHGCGSVAIESAQIHFETGGSVLWICYLGNHCFCIVNLRPEM